MTVQYINDSSNLIYKYSDTQVWQEIFLSWWIDFNYFLYARASDINLTFQTKWEDIRWNIFVILYWKWKSVWHITTNIDNSNCHINILTLSFLQDDNEITIDWDIQLWKNIRNTQWHLMEKNIILWKKIKIKATPRLDVYSDNVQAEHGVTIDQIDPESLFYMGTRWIDWKLATHLAISGYIKNILAHYPDLDELEQSSIEQEILSHINISHD
jgi:hypothetical protein